jgi:acetyl esterase/lipase
MRSQGSKIQVDSEKIAVIGGSAGGHLSLMVGYSPDVPELEGDSGHAGVSSKVQAIVDLYGPVDLTTDFAQNSRLVSRFIGKSYDEAEAAYRLASPISHVTRDDPPTLILHGPTDDVVSIVQSDMLAAKLKATGVRYVYDRLPGWPHAMDLSNDVYVRCRWFMDHFFDRYLPLPE